MSATFAAAAVRLAGVMARVAGWTPDQFWAATPADAATALAAWDVDDGGAPLDRAALAAMMETFPDGR
ncbi:phage tail assembly chaperone [Sphingopyxis sp. KK2]|uniref:phage tail assembly chaperone n=1 Tax=Sphingopyxis sp. KK2 TaxID=1855727 RepID=UPI00097E617C|nr:phage tail assembly chaperone [Sphingopyxis sp. KK2]